MLSHLDADKRLSIFLSVRYRDVSVMHRPPSFVSSKPILETADFSEATDKLQSASLVVCSLLILYELEPTASRFYGAKVWLLEKPS
jgi:hypothetical protein